MKFFDRSHIEALSRFKSQNFLTTSFFLSTDKSSLNKKEINLAFKNLLNDGRARIQAMPLTKEKKESLLQDLDKISLFVTQSLNLNHNPGLALFSCAANGYWQALNLPHPPRNRIIIDQNPYVRPLSAILDRYHRVCVLLTNRQEARWYDIYMGEITALDTLTSDVPGKVRQGGHKGYESKRIERHVEAHVLDHFKKAAQRTFDLFKKSQFDWLFLGCEEESCTEFEPFLHTYLKDRLKGRLKSKPGNPPDKVLKEAIDLEIKLKQGEEDELIQKLVAELERGGRAVSGVRETLNHINMNDVLTLFVTHNYSKEGALCPACRFLYLEEKICPSCQKPTQPVIDIIDEALEAAMKKHAQVKHINPPSKLDHFGKIGAFLRYKV